MIIDLDKDKFTKIMFNLISNALKHSIYGSIIFIILSTENDLIKIEVKDTGEGIPQSEFKNIFERYYQVKTDATGTGIGLALTKHLVELHSGTISVQSKVGEGSVFVILLPVKQESLECHELLEKQKDNSVKIKNFDIPSEDMNVENSKELIILIVEDEWELRHFLKTELSKKYKVILAKNGREGFEIALKEHPDLIISDVMMPEMDGIEFCEKLKNDIRLSHTPVILLTAKILFESQAEGLKSGADIYLPKPFDLQLLQLQINSLILNRQILKRRFGNDPGLQPSELPQSLLDEEFMFKALDIVARNMDNQNFKVSDFVNEFGMSRTSVYNKINAIAGKPVKDFILHVRLQKAAKMLASLNVPISQIAYDCGFSDPSYFSTVFKRYYSQSPVIYRANPSKFQIN